MKKRNKKNVRLWLPRIVGIFLFLFLSLFSLDALFPDPISGLVTVPERIVGFLIHMIPSWILLAILILAWKKPRFAGFILIGLGIILFFFLWHPLARFLFPGLLILTGILFIWSGNLTAK